ncbi:hypothetical protein Q5P01_005291 [Channa striata]|uniref:Uncharacterized protein n=1 Tax=Channa striata TaxID=64152 RepID=A0AA88T2X3_CHASR|nr:hypothetical protein Q5P01_005291 [Channa striata]
MFRRHETLPRRDAESLRWTLDLLPRVTKIASGRRKVAPPGGLITGLKRKLEQEGWTCKARQSGEESCRVEGTCETEAA